MLWNVFFHMKQYYVNNCPLERVSRGLFPWLLIRRLSLYLPIQKYRWVIITAAVFCTLKIASLWLLCCTSQENESVAWDIFECISSEITTEYLSVLALNYSFPSLMPEEHMFSEKTTPHHTQSYSLSNSNASLATQLKFLFPSDTFMFSVLWLVTMKGRFCHWLNWSMDFLSEVFWTIISHINKSSSSKLKSGKEKCSKVESHTTCPPI